MCFHSRSYENEVEKGSAFTLGLLAIKLTAINNSSCCSESQREAALLLGQLAATDSDCKVHIVQRGAVPPLIEMLQSSDAQLMEMSAFSLGRLAQDPHNQADNEDNVADLIMVGGVQKLQDGEFIFQPTRDCVAKTLKRVEEKINGRVLSHLSYLMRMGERNVQRRVALALAHLCSPDDHQTIFVDNNDDLDYNFLFPPHSPRISTGLALLLQLLESTDAKHQRDSSMALCRLANKASSLSSIDAAPPSPIPQIFFVSVPLPGRRFYAHRICLLASSDAFRAMFDGGYRERDAKDREIPNIRWDVFELMMRYIYTGSVDVNLEIAQDLLRAADQYLLEGLKRLCEYAIAQDISVENVSLMFELSEAFSASNLRDACILYILDKYSKLCVMPWYVLADGPSYSTREKKLLCESADHRPNHAELRG
ncbi:hypothetical protein SASPL_157310 [Salvia splendens]|uniref:BTB domain-containing protein n=1 Tax=Salvia splendens TaxID=180675 RepID=A0A8X8VV52_SALSN|nr:hypothetical protein SASPL_157310 [Salvia splendens]